MSDSPGKLTRKQEQALVSLMRQPTLILAAQEVRVSERTLYRWLHDHPPFKSEYMKLRRQAVDDAVAQLQRASGNAVSVALCLMHDPGCPPSTRLAASRVVLELSIEMIKVELLEERIQALELALKERIGQSGRTGRQAYQNGTHNAYHLPG